MKTFEQFTTERFNPRSEPGSRPGLEDFRFYIPAPSDLIEKATNDDALLERMGEFIEAQGLKRLIAPRTFTIDLFRKDLRQNIRDGSMPAMTTVDTSKDPAIKQKITTLLARIDWSRFEYQAISLTSQDIKKLNDMKSWFGDVTDGLTGREYNQVAAELAKALGVGKNVVDHVFVDFIRPDDIPVDYPEFAEILQSRDFEKIVRSAVERALP